MRLGKFLLRKKKRSITEGLIGVASLAVLVAGFPFRVERWSAVGGDPGDAPFRLLEDQVRLLGGVTSWAHPEAAAEKEDHGIKIATSPYPELVARTDADAFGALPKGSSRSCRRGGSGTGRWRRTSMGSARPPPSPWPSSTSTGA